ncbi:MAG: 1-acyl-sn-glycerol-3-phosphate acyltransferase [Acidobacteriota bacterium]|nr:1-acyl-sn-glycerol-3-phosphate acyltransferase [Acidobacteriota bacterium]MDH3525304.1 1-acyl-sn-glycerol-3-phosphate acyltransferase [Acidobacteriota bacterium]
MTRVLRGAARALAVAGVMIVYAAVWLAGLAALRRRPRQRARWRARMFRSWCARLIAVLGVRVEISGAAPAAPFFLVCNHLGYLDVLVLASHLDAVFVAKSEVARWPVLGWICRKMDTVFIDRSSRRDVSRVLDRTREALHRGDGVVVFPEGTSTGGETVRPFLPALLATPVQLGEPVRYATLSYSTPAGEPPAHLAVCWWGGMTFPDHLWRLMGLARIDARLVFGERAIRHHDRKRLAAELHRAVLSDFTPVVGLSPQ